MQTANLINSLDSAQEQELPQTDFVIGLVFLFILRDDLKQDHLSWSNSATLHREEQMCQFSQCCSCHPNSLFRQKDRGKDSIWAN